jgi:hypothetical protein
MPILQFSSSDGAPASFGSPGTGAGTDIHAELERLRSNLTALAQVLEDLRAKHNAHTHGGAVAAPPAGEQSNVSYTLH